MKSAIQKTLSVLALIFLFFAFSGCIKNNSGESADKAAPQNDTKNQLDQKDQQSKKVFQRGGQPGLITLSGILVSQDLKLDSHVETISEAGYGKDGTAAPIEKTELALFSTAAEETTLPVELQTLITLGCDQAFTLDLAKKRSLEIEKNVLTAHQQKILLRAKTVVLCGKIDNLQTTYLTIEADELILNSADLLQIGMGGALSFTSNKLFLFGSNVITSQGPDADLIFFDAPAVSVKVAKQLIADEGARLLVVSKGSSYAEK